MLQAATILVSMASRKKFWRLKLELESRQFGDLSSAIMWQAILVFLVVSVLKIRIDICIKYHLCSALFIICLDFAQAGSLDIKPRDVTCT